MPEQPQNPDSATNAESKGGRPRIPERRTERLEIRLTEREKQQLVSRGGRDVSGYVRRLALGQPVKRCKDKDPEERRALIASLGELGKIGSNLNQLARMMNRGREPEAQAINYALADLARTQERILQNLEK